MGILGRLFGRSPQAAPREWRHADSPRSHRQRSIEAAQTNRLNQLHWANAKDQAINVLLADSLATLRARCYYEMINNPLVIGVVNTHADDVVGDHGPTLQLSGGNKRYRDRLEAIWNEWWGKPDVNGLLPGHMMMTAWVRNLWPCGEFLSQITNAVDESGPISVRLRNIQPRRLDTSPQFSGDPNWTLGVKRTDIGRPIAYCIENSSSNLYGVTGMSYQQVDARSMIHGFLPIDEDQARGLPWLTSALQTIADIRDLDTEVLDAMRTAADFNVIFEAVGQDVPYVPVNETGTFERRNYHFGPPGYTARQIAPTHPGPNHDKFRSEKVREFGRSAGMPLMMIQLDSRQHNYSSARFDSGVYVRSCRKMRAWLEFIGMNRCLAEVKREADLGPLLGAGGQGVTARWVWPPFPSADPKKDEEASSARLANGTSCLRDECDANNKDWEELNEQRVREVADLKAKALAAGLETEWNAGLFTSKPAKAATVPQKPDAVTNDEEDDSSAKSADEQKDGV